MFRDAVSTRIERLTQTPCFGCAIWLLLSGAVLSIESDRAFRRRPRHHLLQMAVVEEIQAKVCTGCGTPQPIANFPTVKVGPLAVVGRVSGSVGRQDSGRMMVTLTTSRNRSRRTPAQPSACVRGWKLRAPLAASSVPPGQPPSPPPWISSAALSGSPGPSYSPDSAATGRRRTNCARSCVNRGTCDLAGGGRIVGVWSALPKSTLCTVHSGNFPQAGSVESDSQEPRSKAEPVSGA
jgi:hypothetical protein